ncbi:hypothetical protein T459_04334 [Capsicum annuum]|uniref:Uncharacterized protein n=1 Tax=Capsicum annuum TaxID=4072 RepID=A0A2G3A4V8_CAPAN|nr:hypothetical protein T459_04334 [Capsicum annuum]
MGSCLSKKSPCSPPPPLPLALANKNQETKAKTLGLVEKKKVEGHIVRREIFVIKHRISHEDGNDNFKKAAESAAPLRRTSSCTKEEVDAILVQCGRLSKSSSQKNALSFSDSGDNTNCNPNTNRKSFNYERSCDFDNENSRGGSRRASRSPVRRSESPISANLDSTNDNGIGVRPGRMVSVPAMVDKNADLISTATIQRIQVKRNVGVASPRARSRSQSPRKVNSKASNDNMNFQQQPLFLSRSNSRKKEVSPFRRNPSTEIVVTEPMPPRLNAVNINNGEVVLRGTEEKLGISKETLDYGFANVYGKVKEQQQLAQEERALRTVSVNAAVDVVASGFKTLLPEGIRRSRSPRLSQDLDINLRVQSNPTQSYTELLLEDIQNFHQKSRNPSFSLPPCVTKACSIVEAVADFNSSTSSNLSSAFSEDRRINFTVERFNKNTTASLGSNSQGKNRSEPYVESEVAVSDDLMEPPRTQKYATFGRGTDGGYMEELESSESSSFVGYQRRRFSPSFREPNSAASTDSWAPPKSYSRLYMNPLAFQKCTVSDHVPDIDEGKSRVTAKEGF